jgi:uncharacterized protein
MLPPSKVRRFLSGTPVVKPILISVDAIESANQPYEADLPRESIDEALRGNPPTEFYADGAATVAARLTKLGRKVLAQSKFTIPVRGQCKRCLKSVPLTELVELTRTYVPLGDRRLSEKGKKGRDSGEEDTAASFDPETVDEEGYEGKEIDLAPGIREQILLALPPSPLCKEDCQGLCPTCGKDLNEGACECDRTVTDPRWEALKAIQLDKKEK